MLFRSPSARAVSDAGAWLDRHTPDRHLVREVAAEGEYEPAPSVVASKAALERLVHSSLDSASELAAVMRAAQRRARTAGTPAS